MHKGIKEIGHDALISVKGQFDDRFLLASPPFYGPKLDAPKLISAHQAVGPNDRLDLDRVAAILVQEIYKNTDGAFAFGKLPAIPVSDTYESWNWSDCDDMRVSVRSNRAHDYLRDRTLYRFDMELLPKCTTTTIPT